MNLRTVTIAASLVLLPLSNAHAQPPAGSFSFNAESLGGANGAAFLTGGGVFDPASSFVKSGGAFRCLADIKQGPLNGIKAGEGIRWQAIELLASSGFRCGTPDEVTKSVFTDGNTVVMKVEFFRQGDGITPSFTANMFVSTEDEGTDLPGTQNVWIQGVGCADAPVHIR